MTLSLFDFKSKYRLFQNCQNEFLQLQTQNSTLYVVQICHKMCIFLQMKKLLEILELTHNLLTLPCDRSAPGGDGYVYIHPDDLPEQPCVPLV